MCHLSLQPHGCGYCSPKPHAPYPRHQPEQFDIFQMINAPIGQGCVALAVNTWKNTQEGDLDCPRKSICTFGMHKAGACSLCPLHPYAFTVRPHLPSWLMHVNQPMQSPCFRKVWACSAKFSCCEGFLRERCVSCRCFLHILTRRENWLPLGRSVQLSTVTKTWQSQAGSHCLTVHYFARLPQGRSLQPGNPKIEYPSPAKCYPARLRRYLQALF